MSSNELKVKIFADGANFDEMVRLASDDGIQGLTTNPTLMKKAGVQDYEKFCRKVVEHISHKPLSFEVFSDDLKGMYEQALKIAAWGENIYVKIPVTNTEGVPTYDVVSRLTAQGVKVNVTAIFTIHQIDEVVAALQTDTPAYVSVFAGRIADTGVDPIPYINHAVELCNKKTGAEVIWASPRELLNVFQASWAGCHIITVTPDILKKLPNAGYDLDEFSLDTVKMFYSDAASAGYSI